MDPVQDVKLESAHLTSLIVQSVVLLSLRQSGNSGRKYLQCSVDKHAIFIKRP